MLKKYLAAALLVLPLTVQAVELKKNKSSGDLNWSVQAAWNLPVKPLSFVQSLDNKKVFVLGTDAKVYIFTTEGKKLGELPVDADTTAIDIAPRGEMLYLINGKTHSYTAIEISFNQKIDITGSPVRGKVDAPVTLVLFSDFECPWCGKIEPEMAQLLEANKDKLRIVFKHLPLSIHAQAEPAAMAAIAAQKQGKFWEMHDALFQTANWSASSVDDAARKVGLDLQKLKADMASPDVRMQLTKDRTDAQNADIASTPSLFINGRPVRERSLAALQVMIDEALAAGGTK